MSVVTLTTRKIIGIVAVLVVLFVLGFVIGWVSAPSDDSRGENFGMKYIANRRKHEMKAKIDFHEKLFKMLNADKIGENLRLVV